MKSYALTIAGCTSPAGIRPGWLITAGTLTEFSYMFRGRVPFPLPQNPWCPQLNPLSDTKTTSVSFRMPCDSSLSRIRPTSSSIAVTAAKYPFNISRLPRHWSVRPMAQGWRVS